MLHPGVTSIQVGDPLDSIAKYSYTTSVNYDFNWSSSIAGFAHLAYNRQGPSAQTVRGGIFAKGDSVETDSTGFLNMRVGAEWDALTLSIFGRNLTNEKRPNIILLASDYSAQSRLRSLGVSLSYKF